MSDWILLLWVASVGAAFLIGRWNGIREFDRQMVEAGLLPPQESRDK